MENENKITSKHIADLAGVSQSTVSFVLNNNKKIRISQETKEKVIEIAKQLNYGPFKEVRHFYNPDNIAIILPGFDNPYYTMLLSILTEKLNASGYRCFLFCTDKSKKKETEILKQIDSPDIKAAIYTFTPQSKTAACEFANKKSVFIIGEIDYNIKATVVELNSKKAGFIAAEHLYELGHTNFAYISNNIGAVSTSRKKRYEGLMDFAASKGIVENVKLFTFDTESDNINDFEAGYELTKAVLNEKKYTALVSANDYTTLGIINALSESNIKVPEDYSVISFDNIPLSNSYYPRITTIDHSLDARVELTIDLLKKQNKNQVIYISYEPLLIIRGSTKKYQKRRIN